MANGKYVNFEVSMGFLYTFYAIQQTHSQRLYGGVFILCSVLETEQQQQQRDVEVVEIMARRLRNALKTGR